LSLKYVHVIGVALFNGGKKKMIVFGRGKVLGPNCPVERGG
jgi:hypothetical protein